MSARTQAPRARWVACLHLGGSDRAANDPVQRRAGRSSDNFQLVECEPAVSQIGGKHVETPGGWGAERQLLSCRVPRRLCGAFGAHQESCPRDAAQIDHAKLARAVGGRGDDGEVSAIGGPGCTPHQLSEVLNRHARITFHELLNRRRVADVKAQLLAPEANRYTIEGIGASAGFGSRSALHAAFRRLEGKTPVEFRKAGQAGPFRTR
jgi:hypothetical protein